MSPPDTSTDSNRLLFVVILVVLLVTAVLVGLAVVFGLRARNQALLSMADATNSWSGLVAYPSTSFEKVPEKEMPDRYKWSDGEKVSYITLNEDHTFINKE